MSNYSVLTNAQAASAVLNLNKTLTKINTTQERMNTGLRVATAKDDASTFTIAMGMRSDVGGFKAIRENLSLGKATVGVASSAAESIGDLLSKIKQKVTQAASDNVSRQAIQRDVDQYIEQVKSIVRTANFNGVNLIDGAADNHGRTMGVLASLDRASADELSLARIEIPYMDLAVSDTGGLQKINGLDVTVGGVNKGANTARVVQTTVTGDNRTSINQTVGFTLDVATTNVAAADSFNFQTNGVSFSLSNLTATTDAQLVQGFNTAAVNQGLDVQLVLTDAAAHKFEIRSTKPSTNVTATNASALFVDASTPANNIANATATSGLQTLGYTVIKMGDDPVFKAGDAITYTDGAGATQTYTFDGTETESSLQSKLTAWVNTTGPQNTSFAYNAATNELMITARPTVPPGTAATGGVSTTSTQGFVIAAAAGRSEIDFGALPPTLTEGDTISLEVNGVSKTYTVGVDDVGAIDNAFLTKLGDHLGVTMTLSGGVLRAKGINDATDTAANLQTNFAAVKNGKPDFDQLMRNVDAAENVLKEVVATLGSASMRLDIQDEFVTNLIKNLDDGIGTLVDANMAEESARFQALQVQQQLGIQALSIANGQPQAILSLFKG